MYIITYLLLFISIIAIGIIIYNLGSDRSLVVSKRLKQLWMQESGQAVSRAKRQAKKQSMLQKYAAQFRKIGIEVTEREVLLINTISFFSLFLIFFLMSKNIAMGFLFGLMGLFLPLIVVKQMTSKRNKLFERLFCDALSLMGNTLRSGFSLRQALQLVSEEMPSPISEEFGLLNQEMNWGLSINEAMLNLNERVPNEYVNLFVTAIMIQSEVGGSLSEIILKIAETIKTKDAIKGELKVLMAQGKMSGIVIGVMPFAIAGLLFLVNPQYIMCLFTTTLGLILLGVAMTMEIMGVLVIKAIVNID
jgi:tight adherence protein B